MVPNPVSTPSSSIVKGTVYERTYGAALVSNKICLSFNSCISGRFWICFSSEFWRTWLIFAAEGAMEESSMRTEEGVSLSAMIAVS